MRKADLVNAISEETGISRVDVLVTVESLFKQIKATMERGENVYVRGFGSFVIKRRAPKVGRNIKRGKSIQIPEQFIPSFKPAKVFTAEVKEKVHALPKDESED
jgi:DNA-binding protein HU-beta